MTDTSSGMKNMTVWVILINYLSVVFLEYDKVVVGT